MSEELKRDGIKSKAMKPPLTRKVSVSCEGLTKEELIAKVKEYRKNNIELLEDKRHLLLRSQEALKMEVFISEKVSGKMSYI